jgi:hypothetical protein
VSLHHASAKLNKRNKRAHAHYRTSRAFMSNRVDDCALVPGSPVSTPTPEPLFEIKPKPGI